MSKKPSDWWDVSLNPIEGCTPISEACQNCWALAMLNRFRGQKPGELRTYPRRLDTVRKWRKSRRVFVGSLTDMLQEPCWPYLRKVLNLANTHYQHTWVFLTKRPENIVPFLEWNRRGPYRFNAPNIWLGITVENQARFNERWPHLQKIPAAVRFLHMEPLLGPVDISPAFGEMQWCVAGSENGSGARLLHIQWVRDIRNQCIAAGVPFWLKSMGKKYLGYEPFSAAAKEGIFYSHGSRELDGREWNELPRGVK